MIIFASLAAMPPACQTRTYTAMDLGKASALSPKLVETIGIGKYLSRLQGVRM